jgi:hypothetical protein
VLQPLHFHGGSVSDNSSQAKEAQTVVGSPCGLGEYAAHLLELVDQWLLGWPGSRNWVGCNYTTTHLSRAQHPWQLDVSQFGKGLDA